MYDLTKPININWELNNICNLMCPQCGRNEIVDGVLKNRTIASGAPKNSILNTEDNSLETFKKVFNNIKYPVDLIRFQGHVSENVASKDFIAICRYIISRGTRIIVSTNGSLRTKAWWYKLGQEFAKNKRSKINFTLDGMGPELEIYRVGANYDKVIENAIAFMEGGGKAEWRMIIFKHNQHQIDDAKAEANKLGFYEFTTVHTNRRYFMNTPYEFRGKHYILENQDRFPVWNKKVDDASTYNSSDESEDISCKAINENQFYVDHRNKVWACYYIPNKKNLAAESEWYKDYYDDDSNNLEDKTLEQILNDKFYDILQMSWGNKNECLSNCKSSCSLNRGVNRSFDHESGKILKNINYGKIQSYVER